MDFYLRTTSNNTTQLTTSVIATPTSSTSCFKPSVKLEIKGDYSIYRTLCPQHLMIVNPSVLLKFNGNEFTLQVILRVGKSGLANLV